MCPGNGQTTLLSSDSLRTGRNRAPEVLVRSGTSGYGARYVSQESVNVLTRIASYWLFAPRIIVFVAAMLLVAFILGYTLHPA